MESEPVPSPADGGSKAEREIRRSPASPVEGFGKLWRKTYRVPLAGVSATPEEVIATWKERFNDFWPEGNEFRARRGIRRGQVALVDISLGPWAALSTGVLVLDAQDDSFTLMTPKGHFFTGWITFSAFPENGTVVAQADVLMRSADPLYELGLMIGGHARENWFWKQTLTRLAQHFGIEEPQVEQHVVCLDRHRQWSHARNIRHNAPLRTTVRYAIEPFRMLARWIRNRGERRRS